MKTAHFPFIAIVLGLLFMLLVMIGSQIAPDGTTTLPLLTLLVISEFSFFVNLIGVYIAIQHIRSTGIQPIYMTATILCVLLAIRFMWLGIMLWPLEFN